MNKKALFLSFLLLHLYCVKNKDTITSSIYLNYSIETLRKRELKTSTLFVESKLFEEEKFISYLAYYYCEGYKLYARLDVPKLRIPEKGYPVVIVNHGFIPPEKYSTIKSYHYVASFFARNGFIVLKPDYRGFGFSEGKEAGYLNRIKYPVDILDLIACIPSIKEADKDNIFMLGHSMGGLVTLIVLEATDRIKAASLWASVSVDFPENGLYFLRKRDQLLANEYLEKIKSEIGESNFYKFSPLSFITFLNTPLIIHHGTSDESVPYEWSVLLTEKLKEKAKEFIFYSYPDEDHNFSKKSFYKVLNRDLVFFKKYILKK